MKGSLFLISIRGVKEIEPPATTFRSLVMTQYFGNESIWDCPTQATKKRVFGGNRRKKIKTQVKLEKTWSTSELISILPSINCVLRTRPFTPIYFDYHVFLGRVLGEPSPVPKRRILTGRQKKGIRRFKLMSPTMNEITTVPTSCIFNSERECKLDGVISFAKANQIEVFTHYVYAIIAGNRAKAQMKGNVVEEIFEEEDIPGKRATKKRPRTSILPFLLLYDNNQQKRRARPVIALLQLLNDDCWLFCLFNEFYKTEQMNFTILYKSNLLK